MMKKFLLSIVSCFSLAFFAAYAQDIQTKGSISGTLVDVDGAVVQKAKVTISGQKTVDRVVATNDEGVFEVENLTPGVYNVRAEEAGFKTASISNIEVFVGKTTALKLKLEAGNISEIVDVSESAAAVDQLSTAVGANLNDQLYRNVPLQRGVTSLFYLAAGATDSLGGGTANPSISGGSPLDNLYIADGVNITDSAFGGLGIFSRVYGTLGVGINTSFIKEVQVKTGGFEPQYGQAQGGIVNIITQSGGNEYHGAIYGFARPKAFEATRLQRDDFSVNKFGKILHEENYDLGLNLGGYVPGLRNNLFFFGSFNPSIRREIVRGAARNASEIANGTGRDSGLFTLLGDTVRRYRTLNYAFKLDYIFNQHHTLAFSLFGDPTRTNLAPIRTLNVDNLTTNSKLDLGTRNLALRYNGELSPTWTMSASFSQGKNHFDESGFDNFNTITDRTQPDRGNFRAIGLGFFEPTEGTTYRLTADTSKQVSFLGTHTFGVGYQYQRALFSGRRDRSGPRFTMPATNATGLPLTSIAGPGAASVAGQQTNASFNLFTAPPSCTLCPFLNIPGAGDQRVFLLAGGEFGKPTFDTKANYHAGYVQDTWRINRFVTALLGLRTEQERLIGNPGPIIGKPIAYSFTGQWAPRLGVTVDPLGHGKTKVYYNFGRFFEYIPLDLAERSLSTELGFGRLRFAPDFFIDGAGNRRATVNEFGTVIPIIDAAHFLNLAAGGTGVRSALSVQDPTNPILPGTKLGFAQEHLIGFEQQLSHGFVLSVRYLDRRLKRIVEDAAVVSPEAADFFGQFYFIGNINSKLDAGVNPIPVKFTPTFEDPTDPTSPITNTPAQCNADFTTAVFDFTGNLLGAVCYPTFGKDGRPAGNSGADGVPDGFPNPVHIYRAVEIEVNKRFSNNWQLLANWRIASLKGNFEGHFRNDNGQTDPGISSLFDFTEGDFSLLGDQNAVGPLNTDRRHVVNIYASYAFSEKGFKGFGRRVKGLILGAGLHMESGVPISEFLAHPIYTNPGEVPVGGRGKLGRTPFYAQLDLHADYPWQMSERMKLSIIADFFNVTNNRKVRLPIQFRESFVGQLNPDFLQPQLFYLPFNMRFGVRLQW
jgi:carboxypeptidase family protein